jgi:hypothetical protein
MAALVALLLVVAFAPSASAEEIKLPPEVTPALRAACEQDVRRHCIGPNPTYETVKRCVEQKHPQFGMRCRIAIASSGLMR